MIGLELNKFRRILRQVMVLPVVALLLLAGVLSWQIYSASSTVKLIQESDDEIVLATLLQKLVADEETGLRGYQITSDTRFLDIYHGAQQPFDKAVADLMALPATGPDDTTKKDLQEFALQHQVWKTAFAEPIIATIGAGGRASAIDLNISGKGWMDTMRTRLQAIVQASRQHSAQRAELWRKQLGDVILVLIVLAIAMGLFLGLFARSRLHAVSAAYRGSLEQLERRNEELFRSEDNLRTTLASIGDGVITCTPDGAIQMMNAVARQLTGWTEDEALNRPLHEVLRIVDEITRQPIEDPVAQVRQQNGIVSLPQHTVLIRKDGSELDIDDSGAPIHNAEGELTGVVMVFRDITMERRTRAALLANEKLAVAGRLAATIAHEIHNPLDSVSNLLYLIEHGSSPEEQRSFLLLAQGELARVTQISRAMLSLYRESHAPVPVDLKDMLEDILLLMERRFHDLSVTVAVDLPPGIVVDGFPAELRQVFTNLITNAAEAAGHGGSVAVRVCPRPHGPLEGEVPSSFLNTGPGAVIEVVDNGTGISTEVHDRLFEPFFTTKGEHGTGLGLWVSQGIIRKHGGSIALRGEAIGPNHGAVATVFLLTKPIVEPGAD